MPGIHGSYQEEAAALIRLQLVLGRGKGFQCSFHFSSLVKSLVSRMTVSSVCAETATLHTSVTGSPCTSSMRSVLSGSCLLGVVPVPFSSIPWAPQHAVLSVTLKYLSNIPFSMSLFEAAAQGEKKENCRKPMSTNVSSLTPSA